jgi:peptidoglycan hydrolase CwlO-like protein
MSYLIDNYYDKIEFYRGEIKKLQAESEMYKEKLKGAQDEIASLKAQLQGNVLPSES